MNFFAAVNSSAGIANKIFYSGHLEVTEKVPGPLELSIEVNRCDTEMKKCEKHPTQKFSNICHRLNDKKAFYYGALEGIKPPIECPIKPQRYVSTNSSIDLTAISFLPISGYVWITTLRLGSGEKKTNKLVLCVTMEIKIVRAPRKRISKT